MYSSNSNLTDDFQTPSEEMLLDGTVTEESVEEQKTVLDKYLEMTVNSCVLPLEMRFSQINGCYRKAPIAYRTFTYINSVLEGTIPPEKYAYAADETDRGIRLTKWNIKEAIKAIGELKYFERKTEFVSCRVSPQIVRQVDFYSFVKDIFDECQFTDCEKLCLEFPKTVLYEDPEQTKMALLSLKLLKVKSMMAGCGDKDNPISPLFDLPFDYVIVSPNLIATLDKRDKQPIMEAFINFLKSTGIDVIADGVRNDKQITILNRADCFGYIPSPAYKGEVNHGLLRMPLDEATLQSDEEEEET
jgi:EAL domain-containing protein (putative c-di-GMP-specific phosphodiesterase class I)